ncbi:hypothetical protein BH11PLA2_BH11PLA2_44660 [soil metagenome]
MNESEIDEILADYLDALDAGLTLPEESLLDAHPQYADELQRFFNQQRKFNRIILNTPEVTSRLKSQTSPSDDHSQKLKPLKFPEIPGYQIDSTLGVGGMGIVYRATQIGLHRQVAIKMMHGADAGDKGLGRFLAEAEAMATFRHPNIVQVFEFGEVQGHPYLSMEYLPGGSLAKRLLDGPLSAREAMVLIRKLALALQVAHDLQIVHRDIKPSNSLFDNLGEPRITDFGLSKRIGAADITHPDAIIGTPAYMSPEQARGVSKYIGPQADIYALGVILYESLSGQRPFQADNPLTIMRQVLDIDPPNLRSISRELPADLVKVCHACLAKTPEDRYASAAGLAEDLRRVLNGEFVSVRQTTVVARGFKWSRRNPAIAASAFLTFFAFCVGTYFFIDSLRAHGQAELIDLQRIHAEQQTVAQIQIAEVNRFYSSLEAIRQRRIQKSPGWTAQNLAELKSLVKLSEASRVMIELRSEAVAALGAIDIEVLPPVSLKHQGYYAATHPVDGTLVVSDRSSNLSVSDTHCFVRVYDPRTGTELKKFRLPTIAQFDGGRLVVISPDGRWLACCTRRGAVAFWDWNGSGNPIAVANVHTHEVKTAGFSPDSRMFYTYGDSRIIGWSEQAQWTPVADVDSVTSAPLIQATGLKAAINQRITFLDPLTLKPTAVTPSKFTESGIFTPSGEAVLVLQGEKIQLRDADRNTIARTLDNDDLSLRLVTGQPRFTFAPHSKLLATGFENIDRLIITDYNNGHAVVAPLGVDGGSVWPSFSPDGRKLTVVTQNQLQSYQIVDREIQERLLFGDFEINHFDVSEDGRRIVLERMSPGDDTYIRSFHDISRGSPGTILYEATMKSNRALNARAMINRQGDLACFSTSFVDFDWVCAPTVGPPHHIHNQNLKPGDDYCESPNGGVFCIRDQSVMEYPFRPEPNEQLLYQNISFYRNAGITFDQIAFGGGSIHVTRRNGTMIQTTPGGKVLHDWLILPERFSALAVNSAGTQAIVGTYKGTVALVDLTSRITSLTIPTAHTDSVTSIAVSPRGLFATASTDRTVKLWNAQGHLILRMAYDTAVRRVQFSNDGQSLWILVNGERGLRCWKIDAVVNSIDSSGKLWK